MPCQSPQWATTITTLPAGFNSSAWMESARVASCAPAANGSTHNAIPVNRIIAAQPINQLKECDRLVAIRIAVAIRFQRSLSRLSIGPAGTTGSALLSGVGRPWSLSCVVGVVLGLRKAEESYQNHCLNCLLFIIIAINNCVFSSWFQCGKGKKEFRLGTTSAKHSSKLDDYAFSLHYLCRTQKQTSKTGALWKRRH